MITDSTLKLIECFEERRYTMYRDSAGIPTIGVGHKILKTEDYLLTATLTDEQVDYLLRKDLKAPLDCINRVVKVVLNQNQFDALCSLVFNIGSGNFINSTLLKKINAGENTEIRQHFEEWCHAGGIEVKGLKVRRKKECDLYFAA